MPSIDDLDQDEAARTIYERGLKAGFREGFLAACDGFVGEMITKYVGEVQTIVENSANKYGFRIDIEADVVREPVNPNKRTKQ